jgi:ubiquitin-protein ligase
MTHEVKLKGFEEIKDQLRWQIIMKGPQQGEWDGSLYRALQSAMDDYSVKPQDKILYSYYLKFSAYNRN